MIIIVSWLTVVLHWLSKQMVQIPQEEKTTGERFENCSSSGLNTLNWWLPLHTFYTFFLGKILVYVKCVLLNHTCIFCTEFDVCILGCSIIFFDEDSSRIETNQSICIASWLFGFYAIWDFPFGNFWTFCNIQWMYLFSFK